MSFEQPPHIDTIPRYTTPRNPGPSHYPSYNIPCPHGGILRGAGAEREPGPGIPGASFLNPEGLPSPSLGRSSRPSARSPNPRYFPYQGKNRPTLNIHECPVRARSEYPGHYRNALPLRAVTSAVTPIIVRRISPCFSAEVIITGAKS